VVGISLSSAGSSALPPIVHIRTDADKAALRWCLDRISQELR
jgi:hypothetical protein